MGTPEFAVPALRAVAQACEVVEVVTQPDRPRGRGLSPRPSAVATAAEALGLEVTKPEDLRASEVRLRLESLRPDLFAVVAFGVILDAELLRLPRLGALNLHGSLLPEYRGASPVQRALWDGRAWTGVTTLWMDEGIDTGALVDQRWVAIEPGDDAGTLAARLAEHGAPLLAESLLAAHRGTAARRPQDRAAGSYARKLGKRDGVVDWSLDAVTVWNHQRAVTPWPGATTGFGGRRLIITRARPEHLLPAERAPGEVVEAGAEGVTVACRPGTLRLERVKPEGRAELAAADWARGVRINPGDRLEALKEETV